MNTRAVAARVLLRITDEGAFSNVLLPHATADLSQLDRGFVYRLVTDALRNVRGVDLIVEQVAERPIAGLDAEVRSVLRIAVAEMVTGSEADSHAHATVNESVEAVKQLGSARAASFVNAVLRRLSRSGIPAVDDSPAVSLSVPDWLFDVVGADHGEDGARELLEGLREAGPATPVRVRPGFQPPRRARPVPGITGAFAIDGAVNPGPGISLSDAASTAVGLALGPHSGELVLDMAAAPGGKTLHLWDLAGGEVRLIALDRHRRRLRNARRRLSAASATPTWIYGDGARAPFADGAFDAVLLDAPCTGLGTLRRRPEIAMRLTAGSPKRLAAQQSAMLAEAWRLTRPGGRIVYSVCTVFAEETVDVVEGYPAAAPEGLPGRRWGRGLLLTPHLTGTDGMFISRIERTPG